MLHILPFTTVALWLCIKFGDHTFVPVHEWMRIPLKYYDHGYGVLRSPGIPVL